MRILRRFEVEHDDESFDKEIMEMSALKIIQEAIIWKLGSDWFTSYLKAYEKINQFDEACSNLR